MATDMLRTEAQLRIEVRSRPDDPFLRNRLGDVLVAQGQTSSALQEFRRSAQQYSHQGFFKRAIAVLRKATSLVPGDTGLAERLVAACRLGNRPALAASAYFNLSSQFMARGDEATAYQYFVRGVEENPTNLLRTQRLIQWAKAKGDRDRAADLHLRIAEQMIHQADFSRAGVHLKKARELRNGPKAARVGVLLLAAQGEPIEAQKLLEESLKRFPLHVGLREIAATTQKSMETAPSEHLFKTHQKSSSEMTKLSQAKAWFDQGYPSRALSLIQRILIVNPGNMSALSLAESIHEQSGYLSRINRIYSTCAERLIRGHRIQEALICLDRLETIVPGSTRAIRRIHDLADAHQLGSI